MTGIKTLIKNYLWRWNYIVPFVNKYRYDEKGLYDLFCKIVSAYRQIHPVRTEDGERSVGKDTRKLLESIQITIHKETQFVYFLDCSKTIAVPGNVLGNFTLAYDKIIHGTFYELIARAKGKDDYGRETEEISAGIERLIQRILEELNTSSLPEKIREKRIHDFSRLLSEPAENFDEALQRILFFNQILWQTRHRLNGLGRLDYILSDLYVANVNSGYLTKEQALDMIIDFMEQLSLYPEYKSDALMGDIGQIIILGGLETDGHYFCSELTELFLQAQAILKKPDPKTLLRVSDKMPLKLMSTAVKCLTSATGSPLFSNDDVVIPALLDFGLPAQDAYSYCTSACWEPYIVGKSLDQNNIAVFDFYISLEELFSEVEFQNFEDLLQAYLSKNNEKFSRFLNELNYLKWAKDPLVSLFTEGCSEKHMDISEGAARYNNYGITTVAISNTVDSLLNIKELVFEKKCCTWQELMKVRKNNFNSESKLLSYLRSDKHFGRDDEGAVELTNRITFELTKMAREYRNRLGGTVKFGLSSPGYNLQGKKHSADFSGRLSKQPYNTHISCMNASYTELVDFAAQLQYTGHRFNGNVVDFFLSGHFINSNLDKFVLFMRGAIREGFFQMQMNIMDSATLIDAKIHPDRYSDLIVRVWGFSAYFNDLPESYKNLLIDRAIASEKSA